MILRPARSTHTDTLSVRDALPISHVIANAFSYVRGYGLRLLPVIQSRSQLRNVYGEHGADEIVSNCGVEIAFTPKELRVAKELSERLGYPGQDAESRSLTIHGLLANRSKTISEQRRALMLPPELMQLPEDDILVIRGGIPVIRSEEHTSELQSLMRISYAVFGLKKQKYHQNHKTYN